MTHNKHHHYTACNRLYTAGHIVYINKPTQITGQVIRTDIGLQSESTFLRVSQNEMICLCTLE